ncbi:MAG: TonB-dependent receptor [Coraliomargarita sp.]
MNRLFIKSGAFACTALGLTAQIANAQSSEETVYELDEYIVSAGPGIRSLADYATPVNVVTSEEISRQSGGTLGAVLDWQPGVSNSAFSSGAARPVLRGIDGPRVRILESGLDTFDVSDSSPDHGVAVEPLLTERVEVLRGPATLLYGSSAIGGAVNVIGKEIPRQPVDPKGYEGSVEARYDTVSEGETYIGHTTVGQEDWALTVTALDRDADDYEIPDEAQHEDEGSTLENSFFESNQYSIGGSWFFTPEDRLSFSYARYESEYGIAGHEDHGGGGGGGGGHDDESVAIDLERDRYDMELELVDPAEWITALRVRLAYTDYEHTEASEDESTTFERDGWEFRTEAAHIPWWIIDEGVVGVQASDSDFEIIGDEAFVEPSTTQTQAIFATQHIHNGDLHYELGGRIERADIEIDDSSLDDYDEVAFSIAASAIWNIDDINSLALVLQRAERNPNATELYANGPHHATGTFELGDDSLDQEVAYGVDLTYRTQVAGWDTELSVFYTYFDDYIYGEETGVVTPEDLHEIQYTAAEAEFYGFEAATQTDLVRTDSSALTLGFMADYVRATNEDTGDDLPRIPPMRIGSRLGWTTGNWDMGGELRYAFKQDDTAEEESETSDYLELNLDVNYTFDLGNDLTAVVFARAENLLDEEIRLHTSYTKEEAPLPGRNLTIGARFEF